MKYGGIKMPNLMKFVGAAAIIGKFLIASDDALAQNIATQKAGNDTLFTETFKDLGDSKYILEKADSTGIYIRINPDKKSPQYNKGTIVDAMTLFTNIGFSTTDPDIVKTQKTFVRDAFKDMYDPDGPGPKSGPNSDLPFITLYEKDKDGNLVLGDAKYFKIKDGKYEDENGNPFSITDKNGVRIIGTLDSHLNFQPTYNGKPVTLFIPRKFLRKELYRFLYGEEQQELLTKTQRVESLEHEVYNHIRPEVSELENVFKDELTERAKISLIAQATDSLRTAINKRTTLADDDTTRTLRLADNIHVYASSLKNLESITERTYNTLEETRKYLYDTLMLTETTVKLLLDESNQTRIKEKTAPAEEIENLSQRIAYGTKLQEKLKEATNAVYETAKLYKQPKIETPVVPETTRINVGLGAGVSYQDGLAVPSARLLFGNNKHYGIEIGYRDQEKASPLTTAEAKLGNITYQGQKQDFTELTVTDIGVIAGIFGNKNSEFYGGVGLEIDRDRRWQEGYERQFTNGKLTQENSINALLSDETKRHVEFKAGGVARYHSFGLNFDFGYRVKPSKSFRDNISVGAGVNVYLGNK